MKNVKYLSTKFKALALTGALALVGTTTGCTAKIQSEPTEDTVVEIEAPVNMEGTIELEQDQTVANIERMQAEIVDLINDQILPNGIFEITEDNKTDKTKMITNFYITFNLSNIDARTLGTINQNGELDAAIATEDYMTCVAQLSDAIALSNDSYNFDISSLFLKDENEEIIDKNDYNYLLNYYELVKTYNQANIDGNSELAQEKLNEIINIKEEIITKSEVIQDINAQTLFLVADSMLMIPNVITNEDVRIQLVNSIEEACEDKIVSEYEIDNTMDTEASQGSYESRFLSLTNKALDSKISTSMAFINDCNSNYSYTKVIEYIVSNLDLTKYNAFENAPTVYEEYIARENEKQEAIVQQAEQAYIEENTYTTTATKEEVAKENRISDEVIIQDNNGNKLNITEQEMVDANNKGDKDAIDDLANGKRSQSDDTSDTGKVYNEAYEQTYEINQQYQIDFQAGAAAGEAQAKSDFSNGFRNTNPVSNVSDKSDAYKEGYVMNYNITWDNLLLLSHGNYKEQLKQAKYMILAEYYTEGYNEGAKRM